MLTKQTIVIIGTGNTGKAIANHLNNGNFHVLICDKDHTKAEALVNELKDTVQDSDVEAVRCSFESAWEADIIILAMNFQAQKVVAGIIKEVVNQKILVCMVHSGAEIIAGFSSDEDQFEALQELLPNTKIVRIFRDDFINDQTVFCKNITGFLIAGKDDRAVEIVSGILESVGVRLSRIEHSSAIASLNNA